MRISLCREIGKLDKFVEFKGLRDGTVFNIGEKVCAFHFTVCSPNAARRSPITLYSRYNDPRSADALVLIAFLFMKKQTNSKCGCPD
jgi:hypothetical protein